MMVLQSSADQNGDLYWDVFQIFTVLQTVFVCYQNYYKCFSSYLISTECVPLVFLCRNDFSLYLKVYTFCLMCSVEWNIQACRHVTFLNFNYYLEVIIQKSTCCVHIIFIKYLFVNGYNFYFSNFLLLLTKICWVHFASLFCYLNQSTIFYKDLLIYSCKYQAAYSVFVLQPWSQVSESHTSHQVWLLHMAYVFFLCCAVYKIHCIGIRIAVKHV